MFRVECPGCAKAHQVDERRVPAKGLQMRCGHCGESFRVEAPSQGPSIRSLTPASGMAAPPVSSVAKGLPKGGSLGLLGPKLAPLGGQGVTGGNRAAPAAPPRPAAPRRKPPLPLRGGALSSALGASRPAPLGAVVPPNEARANETGANETGANEARANEARANEGPGVSPQALAPEAPPALPTLHAGAPEVRAPEGWQADDADFSELNDDPREPPEKRGDGAQPALELDERDLPGISDAALRAAPIGASPPVPAHSVLRLDVVDSVDERDLPGMLRVNESDLPGVVRRATAPEGPGAAPVRQPSLPAVLGGLESDDAAGDEELELPAVLGVEPGARTPLDLGPEEPMLIDDLPDLALAEDLPSPAAGLARSFGRSSQLAATHPAPPLDIDEGSPDDWDSELDIALPEAVDPALPVRADDSLPAVADALPVLAQDGLPELADPTLPALADEEFALPSLSDEELGLPAGGTSLGMSDLSDSELALDGGEFGAVDLPQLPEDRLSLFPGQGTDASAPDIPVPASLSDFPGLESKPPTSLVEPRRVPFESLPPEGAEAEALGDAFDFGDDDTFEPFGSGPSGEPANVDAVAHQAHVQRASDPAAYGELDLGSDASASDALGVDDGMEFGEIPQERGPTRSPAGLGEGVIEAEPTSARGAAASAQVHRESLPPRKRAAHKPRSRRGLWLAAASVIVVGGAGGALAALPRVGPFGYFYISDRLQQPKHEALLVQARQASKENWGSGVFAVARRGVRAVRELAARAPRFEPLAAYAALSACEFELRYGANQEAAAMGLLGSLQREGAASKASPFVEAFACRQALAGKAGDAIAALAPVSVTYEAQVLLGQLHLQSGAPELALPIWQGLEKADGSAMAFCGLAEAELALDHLAQADAAAQAALAQSPQSDAASLIRLEVRWRRDQDDSVVGDLVSQLKRELAPNDAARGQALLGEIHLARGRLSKAEAAFGEALKLDPDGVRSMLGLGDTLFESGRYAAALARYEAAVPLDREARAALGVARCQMKLEQLPAARSALETLRKAHPKSLSVAFVTGLAAAADGDRKLAEEQFRWVIDEGANEDEHAVLARVELARLLSEAGQRKAADQLLADAERTLPDAALLQRAFGEVALAQGHYAKALAAFRRAHARQPSDLRSLFLQAVSLRRLGQYEDAFSVLNEVEKVDPNLPGLPLERGLCLEQSGRGQEALAQYEAALREAPKDLDLMLRVGCGRVSAGDGQAATEVLKPVSIKRPNSAELNYCLGRALALQGQTLVALKRLQRAAELDAHRAEYLLHLGWVANEAGQVAIADRALNAALELDKGLADAYWQRGVMLLHRGAAHDAIVDLKKAIALKPTRVDAHAELAQALYQVGKEQLALAEWYRAVSANNNNPLWLFRYGKLLGARHRNREAAQQLQRAIELAKQLPQPPAWLWEAHHLAAASLGGRPEALEHWEKFLELGPPDSPYREDARKALAAAGRRPSGD